MLLSPPDGRALHYGASIPRGTRRYASPKDTLGYAYASGFAYGYDLHKNQPINKSTYRSMQFKSM